MTNRAQRRHKDRQQRRTSSIRAAATGAPLNPDDLVYGTATQLRRMAEALRQGDKRASTPLAAAAIGRVAAYQRRHPDADLTGLIGRPICDSPTASNVSRETPPGPRAVRIDAAGPGAAELWIDDYLEPANMWGEGISARSVREALDEIGDRNIVVHMNSGGGDYFEGVAIFQALRQHPGNVYVAVDALAASAASVVIMAGDTVGVGEGAFIMVHEASTFAYGNADDLLTRANMLDEVDGQIAGFYARKAGDTAEEWRERMAAETWFGPSAAIDVGLADEDLAPPPADGDAIDPDPDDADAEATAAAEAVAALFSIDVLRPAALTPNPEPAPAPPPAPVPDPIDFSALFSADMEDLLL